MNKGNVIRNLLESENKQNSQSIQMEYDELKLLKIRAWEIIMQCQDPQFINLQCIVLVHLAGATFESSFYVVYRWSRKTGTQGAVSAANAWYKAGEYTLHVSF